MLVNVNWFWSFSLFSKELLVNCLDSGLWVSAFSQTSRLLKNSQIARWHNSSSLQRIWAFQWTKDAYSWGQVATSAKALEWWVYWGRGSGVWRGEKMDLSPPATGIWQGKPNSQPLLAMKEGMSRRSWKKLNQKLGYFCRKSQNLKSVPIFPVPGSIGWWK